MVDGIGLMKFQKKHFKKIFQKKRFKKHGIGLKNVEILGLSTDKNIIINNNNINGEYHRKKKKS